MVKSKKGKMFEGIQNYINGIEKTNFFRAFGLSLLVTVLSVAVLLLCTSMCAWYIVRVKSVISSVMFYGFVFSMIVPFQMVMFTLSKIANMLKLTTPLGLVLDSDYQTIPIAIQYLKGGHGSVDMGAMMATLVLSIIPIVIFYMICQKHIIEGVVAGAVKG